MHPDLLRQRRNLVAISAILLVFDFANVQITKISIIGTELLVGNANVLMICAWILWAYFMLRYYQYWRSDPHPYIRENFKKRFEIYTHLYSKQKPLHVSGGRFNNYSIKRTTFWSWDYVRQGYDPVREHPEEIVIREIPAWRFAIFVAKSALYVCFQTPYVTDHILPFALGFAAPLWNLYTYGHPKA